MRFGWIGQSLTHPRRGARGRFLALAFCACAAFAATPAHASLQDALNNMFVVSGTAPQAIDSQRLRGVYGGQMSLRSAARSINIVQFAAPSIDAGCGGIDIFFGSFSFINGAQFEQLVRAIVANATGYAVRMAIKLLCSTCDAILADLEAAIRDLNALAKNTCAITMAVLDPDAPSLMNRATNVGKNLAAAIGKVSDIFTAENGRFTSKPNDMARQGGTDPSGGDLISNNTPYDGNVVFKAAQDTIYSGGNILSMFLDAKSATELVMGLYGTAIYNPDSTGGTAGCPPGVTPERCVDQAKILEPTISSWQSLFYPSDPGGTTVWRCISSDCRRVNATPGSLSGWKGVENFVDMGLFGVPRTEVSELTVTADSLVGAFVLNVPPTVGSLNGQAQALLRFSNVPIITLLQEVQGISGGPLLLGAQMAQLFPDFVAYRLANDLQALGQAAFTTQSTVVMPPVFERNLKLKAQELYTLRPNLLDLTDALNGSVESVINLRAITGSPLRSTSN